MESTFHPRAAKKAWRFTIYSINSRAIDSDVMTLSLEPIAVSGASSVSTSSAAAPTAKASSADLGKYKDLEDIRISVGVKRN